MCNHFCFLFFSALEKFISLAGQYLEGEGYDIVSGYCRSSEECTEILQLLDGGKRKPSEVYSSIIMSLILCIRDDFFRFLADFVYFNSGFYCYSSFFTVYLLPILPISTLFVDPVKSSLYIAMLICSLLHS